MLFVILTCRMFSQELVHLGNERLACVLHVSLACSVFQSLVLVCLSDAKLSVSCENRACAIFRWSSKCSIVYFSFELASVLIFGPLLGIHRGICLHRETVRRRFDGKMGGYVQDGIVRGHPPGFWGSRRLRRIPRRKLLISALFLSLRASFVYLHAYYKWQIPG